jgi:tetratricopeptide (TPR) repeat protein
MKRFLEAVPLIEEAVDFLRGSSEPIALIAFNRRSSLLLDDHRYEQAAAAQEFLAMARALGNRASEAIANLDLGKIHSRFGRYERAMQCFREAIQARKDTSSEEARRWGVGIAFK